MYEKCLNRVYNFMQEEFTAYTRYLSPTHLHQLVDVDCRAMFLQQPYSRKGYKKCKKDIFTVVLHSLIYRAHYV